MVFSLALWSLLQRFSESSGHSFSVLSEEGGEYIELVIPWVLYQKGFDTGCSDSFFLGPAVSLGFFFLFPDTTCMHALSFHGLLIILFFIFSVVFVVPDL